MSSQRGNANRTRPQKHQNRHVFKNDLHDTNIRTKRMNQIQITNVCNKCKSILEWKIKYKKYKVLKAPKCCNKCLQRNVKLPYHTVCHDCAKKLKMCPKCEMVFEQCDNEVVDSEKCCDNDVNQIPNSKNVYLKLLKFYIRFGFFTFICVVCLGVDVEDSSDSSSDNESSDEEYSDYVPSVSEVECSNKLSKIKLKS